MKKLILLTFIAYMVLSGLMIRAQGLSNGLVGYYPFNGNANDESANSYDGAVNGASLTSDRFGTPSKAYLFNGSSNYLSLSHSYDLLPRTVSLWFYVTEINTTQSVMYSSDNQNLTHGMTAISFKKINNVNKVIYNVADIIDTADITMNEWHHTVITVNSGTTSIYLDCNLLNAYSITTYYHSMDGSTSDVIGSSRSISLFYKGKVDDIRIYNRVLNSDELDSLCIEATTGIDKISGNFKGLKVYPNPSNGLVNVDLLGYSSLSGYQLKVVDVLSQDVFSSVAGRQVASIDLSACSKGVYMVCLLDASGVLVQRKKLVLR
jgi:hypothetical protein